MKKYVIIIALCVITCQQVYSQPSKITDLSANSDIPDQTVLNWTYLGPDILPDNSKYEIQKSTYYEVDWATGTVGNIAISTGPVNPGEIQSYSLTLDGAATYYFHIWSSSGTAELLSPISDAATSYILGAPHHIKFISESRKLIAGTTIQFYGTGAPGVEIDTITVSGKNGDIYLTTYDNRVTTVSFITAEFRDINNIPVISTESITVKFECIDSSNTYANTISSDSLDNPSWQLISDSNYLEITMPAGSKKTSLYCFETNVGTYTLKASGTSGTGVEISSDTQKIYITPATIRYFTIHHQYGPPSIPVYEIEVLAVKARDRYGNVAAGDSLNGQYYTGTVLFSHSGIPERVTLEDYATMESSYTFTRSDSGKYNELMVGNEIQESLTIYTTHYEFATVQALDFPSEGLIFGYTNDTGRDIPVHSDSDVLTYGVVITPDDLAPEDPPNPTKQALLEGTSYYGRVVLYQGDGETEDVPYPIPLLRLKMKILPVWVGATAKLDQIRVDKLGTLPYSDVTELEFYHDTDLNGKFEPYDQKLASGTYNAGDNAWYFDNLSIHSRSNITGERYFICVRISTTATVNKTLGLKVSDWFYVTVTTGSTAKVAANNFEIKTTTSNVDYKPGKVYTEIENIAAWYDMDKGTWTFFARNCDFFYQGTSAAGMLKIGMWTDSFTGILDKLKISHTGTGSDADLFGAMIYLDDGNGEFQPAADQPLILDGMGFPDWVEFEGGIAECDISPNQLIDPTTKYFFVAYSVDNSATSGLTHGAAVEDIILSKGTTQQYEQVESSQVVVYTTSDEMNLVDVNRVDPGNFSVPPSAIQGEENVVIARLTFGTRDGTAIWEGLKIDRVNLEKVNKPTDVTSIKVWYDIDEDGLFRTTDQMVTPIDKIYTFPTGVLSENISETSDIIKVNDIEPFVPADSPFPDAPGRLVINDGSSDLEIVIYTGVDKVNNTFTGALRGQEGTTAQVHLQGTIISGQAILPIEGPLGGQEIEREFTVLKDYFVTFDISTCAVVSDFSQLGLEIPSTDCFAVVSPDFMANRYGEVGLRAPRGSGMSESYVTRIFEDITEPAQITDLVGTTHPTIDAAVQLTWTAVGDNGAVGSITDGRYWLKYSINPADTWSTAPYELIWSTDTSPGRRESKTLTGLIPSAEYYLWIKTADGGLQWSVASNRTNCPAKDDVTPPTTAILEPQNNSYKKSLLTISGTASDNVVISTVQISMYISTSTNNWWDGTGFNSSTQLWVGVDSTIGSEWTYTDTFLWADGSSYTVIVKTKDSSNNWSTIYATNTFTFDTSPPINVGCLSPVNNSVDVTLNTLLIVVPAADLSAGLHSSPYYIQLSTNSLFAGTVQNSGWQTAINWSPTLNCGTTYYWRVKAKDAIGNETSYYADTDTAGYWKFTTVPLTMGYISGKITKTNGIGVYQVKIEALQDNIVISTASSNIDGEFLLSLSIGDYTLKVSKIGYKTQTKPVTVYTQQTITENITLEETFEEVIEEKEKEIIIPKEEGEIKIIGGLSSRGAINPTRGEKVKVGFKGTGAGRFTLRVFNLVGEIVYKETKETTTAEGYIDWLPQDIPSGVYMIHVEGPGVDIHKKTVIIR